MAAPVAFGPIELITRTEKHMARRVEVVLVDDLDGTEASETVSFSLDGYAYEIDLSDGNAVRLREALATYVGAGRKVNGGGTAKRGRRAAAARA